MKKCLILAHIDNPFIIMKIEDILAKYSAFLTKYNFSEEILNDLITDFKKGRLSADSNRVSTQITAPKKQDIINLSSLSVNRQDEFRNNGLRLLIKEKVGYIILNGGMATRFGNIVKGLVKVYDNETFLSIKVKLIKELADRLKTNIPIYIMNSFSTDEPTLEYFEKNKYFGIKDIHFFNQSISLRLNKDGEIFSCKDGNPSFYAPGHGDLLNCFKNRNDNTKYFAISNVDNLFATIDPKIIGFHHQFKTPMTVETTRLNRGDKGGAPVIIGGKLQILEGFRFPLHFNFNNLKVFNANTFILSREIFEKKYNLTWFVVEKEIKSSPVIQFETLIGELSSFVDAKYIEVPRDGNTSRFFPIKTREELENNRNYIKQVVTAKFAEIENYAQLSP